MPEPSRTGQGPLRPAPHLVHVCKKAHVVPVHIGRWFRRLGQPGRSWEERNDESGELLEEVRCGAGEAALCSLAHKVARLVLHKPRATSAPAANPAGARAGACGGIIQSRLGCSCRGKCKARRAHMCQRSDDWGRERDQAVECASAVATEVDRRAVTTPHHTPSVGQIALSRNEPTSE